MARKKPFAKLIVVALLALTLAAAVAAIQVLPSLDLRRLASSPVNQDCGRLTVGVSTTGERKDAKSEITITRDYPRYYIHILNSEKRGRNCSTSFDVKGDTITSPWKTDEWGIYRSNSQGVARIDLPKRIGAGTYTVSFRPHNSNAAWSNNITTVLVDSGSSQQAEVASRTNQNLSDYFPSTPGYSFEYITTNHMTGRKGVTRLQLEEKMEMCGVTMVPWRYTKDSHHAYWAPYFPKEDKNNAAPVGADTNLRWLVVDKDYRYSDVASYNNYFWAYGHKSYHRSNSRDLDANNPLVFYDYAAVSNIQPAYSLMPKVADLPYTSQFSDSLYTKHDPRNPNYECRSLYRQGQTANAGWRTRIEKVDLDDIDHYLPNYQPKNEIVKVDYYEGQPKDLMQSPLLRETWYYEKNVGPILLLIKQFNGISNTCQNNSIRCARSCAEDSDCLADVIEKPHYVVSMTRNFQNPQLRVTVKGDNGQFGSFAEASLSRGYTLKVDPPYTGYLEAQLGNNSGKWLWVQNGITIVGPNLTRNLPTGDYPTRFRIWVPDEQFRDERRVGDQNVPWSNQINVRMIDG